MTTRKKHHHYVWAHYLKAWAARDLIACYRQRDQMLIRPNVSNIGGETYFYRLRELTAADLAYLLAAIRKMRPDLRQAHLAFLERMQSPFRLRRQLDKRNLDPVARAEAEAAIDESIAIAEEDYHSLIEDVGEPLLADLREGRTGFYEDEDASADFLYYLGIQYFRTARMRNVVERLPVPTGTAVDFSRTWPIERHIYATNLGDALFRRRATQKIVLLENPSDIAFITADQPVINLLPTDVPAVSLYYPLSPVRALVLTEEERWIDRDPQLSGLEVEHLNFLMYRWSDDQLYGRDGAYLEALASLDKAALA